jgi:hypothetical protein
MTITLPEYFIAIEGRDLAGAARSDYEQQVVATIKNIQARKSGRLLLYWIRHAGPGLWVVIAPYGPYWEKRYGKENALAQPEAELLSEGFGVKWAMKVNFSVGTWALPCSAASTLCGGPGFLPDEVLLHELVHTQRHISGLDRQVSLKGTSLEAYENEEEFFAVTVANLYMSESGRTASAVPGQSRLRSDHGSGALSADEDWDLVQFVDPEYVRLVKKYCEQHPNLSRGLAGVDAKFNPFRTHYRLDA